MNSKSIKTTKSKNKPKIKYSNLTTKFTTKKFDKVSKYAIFYPNAWQQNAPTHLLIKFAVSTLF